MSDNHPYRLADDLVTQALRARSADPDLALLDDIVRTAATTPQLRRWPGLGSTSLPRRAVLVIALLLLLAAAGALAIGSGLLPPDPVPAEQLTVAGQIIEAANTRDPESLRSLMAEDGVLEFPWVDARAGREGEVYMDEYAMAVESFPEAWVGNLDRWSMEAHLGSCQAVAESTITCAVATRWHTLQIEIGEAWTFEFDGRRVTRLHMLRVDPDPPDRLLPMGLTDLPHWEAWLRETHPSQADRLLPSGPDEFGWMYFRFALDASPDEIGASIDEYLAARSVVESPTPTVAPTPVSSMLPALGMPARNGAGEPAGVYGWSGQLGSATSSFVSAMHHVVEGAVAGEYRQTVIVFANENDCFGGDGDPVSVTVAGLDGLYVEPFAGPYELSTVFGRPNEGETTGAYSLEVGDRTLCVYLSWDSATTPDELKAARQVVESIRGQPYGGDGIRINFTLPQGWDTG